MEFNFINVLDLIRFMAGLIAAEYVFFDCNCQRRKSYGIKFICGLVLLNVGCLSYFPIHHFVWKNPVIGAVIMAIWWSVFSLATLPYMYLCYEVSLGILLFYYIFSIILQEIITLLLRYFIVGIWMPELPEQYTGCYVALMIVIYAVSLLAAHHFIANKIAVGEEEKFFNQRYFIVSQIILILVFTVVQDITSGLFAWIVQDVGMGDLHFVTRFIMPYYLTGLLVLFCVVVFIFMLLLYRIIVLNQNNLFMEQLHKQKEQQYATTKENIDIINQKCHDLKHQLKAIKMADDSEKEQLYQETKEAIDFYDATVHTGIEVIDTILTEKSLVCSAHQINLSCNVSIQELDFIHVVDLYTILGNAIDNAIEAVLAYPSEKRIISLWIKEQGQMVNFMVDNYFEGKLVLKNGYPITSKEDRNYHGFGIKSIRMTVRKYHGDMRISQDGNTFSLQVMIPREK